jgi:hypothetical protein
MPEQPDPKAEERDRFLLGCAVIQSGYVDQDEDAPGWFDILQWHPCFEEANCRARDNTGPCACSGVPFISDEVWAKVGPVVVRIRAEAYERGLREATEGWERAVATLRDVADRTGSPAARWAADYLAADPDRLAPPEATEGPAFTDADVEVVAELSRRELGASVVRWRDWERARQILNALTASGRRLVGPWEPAPAVNAEQPGPSRCAWVPIPGGRCPHCGEHGADEQSEPSRGGTVATEPDTHTEGGVPR